VKALAHSSRLGVPAQYYDDHIERVVTLGCRHAERIKPHSPKWGAALFRAVRLETEFHDLGKLDPANQEVLRKPNSKEPLKVREHWDPGVAHLLSSADADPSTLAAALAIYSHHAGLPSLVEEENRLELAFRAKETRGENGPQLCQFNDQYLARFLNEHRKELAGVALPEVPDVESHGSVSTLFRRMCLSCLVDADHSDTARHQSGDEVAEGLALNGAERLAALKRYVAKLATKKVNDRTPLRELVFQEAQVAPIAPAMLACDSPVGTGKTTAVMAHLLQAAIDKKLRRIFVVLPYTNIINQSVRTYRCALRLPGENARDIVAAHHHRTEFDSLAARQYAFLWHSPIVVTTAVQFFETLAAARTSALRKLHQLPGSAIFIDEAHTALPIKLWPLAWRWLKELTSEWGCHCVLASGSLYEFWKLTEFSDPPMDLPPLLPASCRQLTDEAEKKRVGYEEVEELVRLDSLPARLSELDGPRLLIVNTVQSAAVVADRLDAEWGRSRCEHLSTALTPCDRDATYRRIQSRLKDKADHDWVLVATSCVEAGVDFDFASGMRERAGFVNLLQASGRVNREARPQKARMLDFRFAPHPLLTFHPGFTDAIEVLGELFAQYGKDISPAHCLEALQREMQRASFETFRDELLKRESGGDFPEVQRLFQVIESDTRTVVIDQNIRRRLEEFEKVRFQEIQAGSVQIWSTKLKSGKWPIAPIGSDGQLWAWTGQNYSAFTGYMADILPLLKAGKSGFDVL